MSKTIALGIVMIACNLPGLRLQAQDSQPRVAPFPMPLLFSTRMTTAHARSISAAR